MYQGITAGIAMLMIIASCSTSKLNTAHNFIDNKVIAHRGAWKHTGAPQNSMEAIRKAWEMGCAGVEFDIRMTSDGIPVLNHDPGYKGMNIDKYTYEELKAVTLPNGEFLPLLEEVIKAGIRQNTTKLVFEIKALPTKEKSLELTEKVVAMVKNYEAGPWAVYISFDLDVCKKVKALDPNASVQYLTAGTSAEALKEMGMDADYNFTFFQKNEGWIKKAHETGIIVNAWTVNSETVMDELLQQNIDYITTDEPEILIEKMKNRGK